MKITCPKCKKDAEYNLDVDGKYKKGVLNIKCKNEKCTSIMVMSRHVSDHENSEYTRNSCGALVRKIPKEKLTKKERRKENARRREVLEKAKATAGKGRIGIVYENSR